MSRRGKRRCNARRAPISAPSGDFHLSILACDYAALCLGPSIVSTRMSSQVLPRVYLVSISAPGSSRARVMVRIHVTLCLCVEISVASRCKSQVFRSLSLCGSCCCSRFNNAIFRDGSEKMPRMAKDALRKMLLRRSLGSHALPVEFTHDAVLPWSIRD